MCVPWKRIESSLISIRCLTEKPPQEKWTFKTLQIEKHSKEYVQWKESFLKNLFIKMWQKWCQRLTSFKSRAYNILYICLTDFAKMCVD